MTDNLGPLAVSLAKAQVAFPAITRSRTVTVQTKTGGSYSFKYAPLDTILEAVRKPLADNGLAVVQTLDDGELVTTLIHESGAVVGGRLTLPPTNDIQALGSAITYLRRYALQAVLGVAAEEDDDGNRAAGNNATAADRQPRRGKDEAPEPEGKPGEPTYVSQGTKSYVGTVAKGDGQFNDVLYHQTPSGHLLGFRLELEGGNAIHEVLVTGPIGEALFLAVPDSKELLKATVEVEGEAFRIDHPGRRARARLAVSRIKGPGFTIPAPEAPSLPLFDADEQATIDAAVDAVLA